MKWLRRILIALGTVLLLAIIGIFLVGLNPSSRSMTSRIEINKPGDVVWKHFHDPEKTKKWVSWLVEIRDLTPDNHGVGAKEVWVMEDRNNNNQRMEISNEVTALDPGRRMDFKMSSPEGFEGTGTYLFESLGANRTAVTSTSTYRFSNPFANFMAPVVMRFAAQKMTADLERFKQNVEKE